MTKFEKLKENLRGLGSAAVAFSGGVDSTFLLKVAQEVLGEKVLALTAASKFVPRRELAAAEKFCAENKIRQIIFAADVLKIAGVKENPADRCYLCKRELFKNFLRLAEENNCAAVVEGSNMDDLGDYRPGAKAIRELQIKSPLQAAELYKAEIRELSKKMNLPTWNKPSMACLASRIPYGELLTEKNLSQVEMAEEFLLSKGFNQLRVRIHGKIARIEILPAEFDKIIKNREEITSRLKNLGFDYVTLDLQGFRSGSMNLQVAN